MDPSHILKSHLLRTALEQLAERRQQLARIRTPQDFEERRRAIREKILRMIGGLPSERTALNVRRVGSIDRGDYRVDKITYESLPKFYVTANLYIPKSGKAPYPAVLQPLGHGVFGKTGFSYQVLSINLAKLGFVVLTFDPIGQGERRIFWDEEIGDSKVGSTTDEHSMVGVQSVFAGESVARYRIWDGIRGIDVLQGLPEVDSKRIGITGCSGGGTLTVYIAALDDRIQTAAPGCYVSSWEDQLSYGGHSAEGPQDAEQQFVDQFSGLAIDHADMVTTMAPKPYLICSMAKDTFPISGAYKAYEDARNIYALFGAEERLGWHIAPGNHGFYELTREAIYGWMSRWLKKDAPVAIRESTRQVELDEDLYCTATGQVASSLGGETASTLNVKRFREMVPARQAISNATELQNLRARVSHDVVRLTRYSPSRGPLNLRSRGEIQQGEFVIEKLVYDADGGRCVPALLYRPSQRTERRRAIIYVNQSGKSAGRDASELARLGYTVLAVDPSGIGEVAAKWGAAGAEDSARSVRSLYAESKITWLALMVGQTLVGLRMDEMIRGLDVLKEKNLLYNDRALGFGKGLIAVSLLHAAVVEPRFDGLIMDGGLLSFHAVARTPIHRGVFEVAIPGVLGRYDLPDLVAVLAPRPVWVLNAASAMGDTAPSRGTSRVPLRSVESEYTYAAQTYAAVGATDRLKIRRPAFGMTGPPSIADAYPELR
jgi:cephalosporin-C deacetylase-like acetyl esterase